MFFDDLLKNQPFIKDFFSKVLEKGFLSRSYLLLGDAFTEKKILIKQLNKILNCDLNKNIESNNSLEPACSKCLNCKWIESDSHPRSPINISPEGELKSIIKVERLKESLEELSQSSEYFRIIVIEDANFNVLNSHSATVLLKTIEEAKPRTMFILLASQEETVLKTIKSRSQVLMFNATDKEEYKEEILEKYNEYKDLFLNLPANKLEMILNSEKLAELKPEMLIQILSLIENELNSREKNLENLSEKVLLIEDAITALKSYVKPKAELYDFSKKLAAI